MSWLLNLYETYQENLDRIGKIEERFYGDKSKTFTLLPISHTTQTAHIEILLTKDGSFHSATVTDKENAVTVIPCTEASSSRAGSIVAPYPLHDKLMYVAGDYEAYGGQRKDHFHRYIENLELWANSPHGHPKLSSILAYLKQKTLIRDLVKGGILHVDENHQLIEKWDKKYGENKPDIFSFLAGDQLSAFVRFDVHSYPELSRNVWNDTEMYDSFIQFYNTLLNDEDVCFVKGEVTPHTERHANKIRHSGDKAKLISSNDKNGFTFRGRFDKSQQVASIGYEVSQKAHNALKWLIQYQGKLIDQRVFLVWQHDQLQTPSLFDDPYSFEDFPEKKESFTAREYAKEISKALSGYEHDFRLKKRDIHILILDAATTGRLAVLYYINMDKYLYLKRLNRWYVSCCWRQRYTEGKTSIGTPTPKDIAFAMYGPQVKEQLIKEVASRLVPYIVGDQINQNIPKDIVNLAFQRATNPVAMKIWEWEKTLGIACALVNIKEGMEVALDHSNKDRSYLFGRLLAIADVLERRSLGSDEQRATNAIRYMNAFSRHPERTWTTIYAALQPYRVKLGARGMFLEKMMDEVLSSFAVEDYTNKPLSGKYILGFSSQRHELYQKRDQVEKNGTGEKGE
ncbi:MULTISPECIES: type I-C CRISPR-associated protein Cas8c/Csd1 [Bacillus]|uniref:type I-C CRISPR-associated protein Cas8c/Csd1 n=1 Tax=Bacillus TaxID=1386 RepID=UPI0005D3B1F7|nr:type I-C CRISPR-associated protein Cas8c/Csd1 [Bacillus altitudinis]KQL40399.1 CRISPR-associated protein Cas8 [Bacillus sp. FJAT-21955]KJF48488.1 CRISPR-associated protein Cas8 [Bacillus altitudinis]MBU8652867.1 type I-C CRISPR-associated protein Cas8c/Csd1 [Bacillus altitudinis]MBU8777939.1 type I-C CRISPR-associated protein Cas8c/Csd1 [Bacillus altitudinis]RAU02826.1 type I-C CRISPR-associated protein Cas8c/Csd1 [Bacillus altitudinis]